MCRRVSGMCRRQRRCDAYTRMMTASPPAQHRGAVSVGRAAQTARADVRPWRAAAVPTTPSEQASVANWTHHGNLGAASGTVVSPASHCPLWPAIATLVPPLRLPPPAESTPLRAAFAAGHVAAHSLCDRDYGKRWRCERPGPR